MEKRQRAEGSDLMSEARCQMSEGSSEIEKNGAFHGVKIPKYYK